MSEPLLRHEVHCVDPLPEQDKHVESHAANWLEVFRYIIEGGLLAGKHPPWYKYVFEGHAVHVVDVASHCLHIPFRSATEVELQEATQVEP